MGNKYSAATCIMELEAHYLLILVCVSLENHMLLIQALPDQIGLLS